MLLALKFQVCHRHPGGLTVESYGAGRPLRIHGLLQSNDAGPRLEIM